MSSPQSSASALQDAAELASDSETACIETDTLPDGIYALGIHLKGTELLGQNYCVLNSEVSKVAWNRQNCPVNMELSSIFIHCG